MKEPADGQLVVLLHELVLGDVVYPGHAATEAVRWAAPCGWSTDSSPWVMGSASSPITHGATRYL